MSLDDLSPLLTPKEVAALFRVDPKTVNRWAKQKKLTVVLTPGNEHRFRETEVYALLKDSGLDVTLDDNAE